LNPIDPFTAFGIYVICWWVVLFTVLPLGMNQGAQERPEDGGDWGAPAKPNLKKKFVTTTWVSAIAWIVVMAVLVFGLIPLPGEF
jgi:predicted secreted protein